MNESNSIHFYAMALTLAKGIGPVLARKLVQICGSPEAVFGESSKALESISGIGVNRIKQLQDKSIFSKAEAELRLCKDRGWLIHYIGESTYPRRLKQIDSAPLILFQKGRADLNPVRSLAMVGSRRITEAGQGFVEEFLRDLKAYTPHIISGLAYGVDAQSHRHALKNKLETIAVLAHGLNMVYPKLHRQLAENIIDQGGALVSEYCSESLLAKENFPKRNRIIAGMADAIVVAEAANRGGALITAQYANDYNRDVFAVPGKPGDRNRDGCNLLIKSHRAHLLEKAQDLSYILRWEPQKSDSSPWSRAQLSSVERAIVEALSSDLKVKHLDAISLETSIESPELLSRLCLMELQGWIKVLPGNRFRLIN